MRSMKQKCYDPNERERYQQEQIMKGRIIVTDLTEKLKGIKGRDAQYGTPIQESRNRHDESEKM